jgi:predicted glycoside hydrolase/deacetylase ChbG (UPF0249 family)
VSQLIINADDLGYTEGVDRAVLELHAAGALSSATAMAGGSATRAHASSWTRAHLPVGAHIVLVDGDPASPASDVPSLLQGGRFRPKLGPFVRDLWLGRIREADVEREAIAQIRALQELGLALTHIDTHKHTHMFPQVLRPLLRGARACGIRAVRNPFEPAWAVRATLQAPWLRRAEVRLLATFRRSFLAEVDRAGLRTTAGALGVAATGTLNAPGVAGLFDALDRYGRPDEWYELVCHPAFHDAALDAQPTRLRAAREEERAALLSVVSQRTYRAPAAHAKEGRHRLVSFAHL